MTFGYWSKVKAVDTVAAGDSFNGALAEALSEGKRLHEVVLFGNAMGALTVQKKGAIPLCIRVRGWKNFCVRAPAVKRV